MEREVVSEKLAEARDLFGRGCKYSIVTSSDECGSRSQSGYSKCSHLLPTDRLIFGEGDVVAGGV